MLCKCKIKKLYDSIEEAVLIETNGYELYCFISYCTFEIFENKYYEVDLSYEILDDYILNKSNSTIGFNRIKDGFSYELTAELQNNQLVLANLKFDDDFLLNYSHLNNCTVSLLIDRLNVEFIKPL